MANLRNIHTGGLPELPQITTVLLLAQLGGSDWAESFRIDVELLGGEKQSYFLKVSRGHHGRESLKGEFESTLAIRKIAPNFIPRPIGWGTYATKPDTHFFLAEFQYLTEGPPEPELFCERLAKLHLNGVSPNGKFGFPVVTYNGNLPQENRFTDTWEEFFSNGLRHMFQLHAEKAGPCERLEELKPSLFYNVIPRLLRPLETGENPIKPCLVHGDLWCGNTATDFEDNRPLVFDPCSFWAHNEYELGNWLPKRNKFTKTYVDAYHSHFPKSSPEEDYDDRIALYALRFNLHAATMFPDTPNYRESVIQEMQRLTEIYPG